MRKGPPKVRADAVRNRARIVEIARAVFGKRGTSAGMDDIAEAVGVGVGTLYRHFPTKEALIAAIVQEQIESTATEAAKYAADDDSGAAFFEFLAKLWASGAQKKALVDALAGSEVDIRKTAAAPVRELKRAIATLLSRAQREGAVRPDVEAADVLAFLGASLAAAQRGTSGDVLFTLVCDGLRPPKPRPYASRV
jgi:AcrR family transcriptional regulator